MSFSKSTHLIYPKINIISVTKICVLTSVISPIISNLFNLCIETGVFPNCLKIAKVIPIYKKGDQNMPTNYRPISLLSQFDKIFNKMLFSRLFSYLDKNQLLNKNQFGFRPNSSTQFAISTIHDKLIKNIDNGLYQRGPTTGPRAACGPRNNFVRPVEQFCTIQVLSIISSGNLL